MGFKIDDAFIARWEPMYDRRLIGDDEKEYLTIKSVVAEDLAAMDNTISKTTFLRIWEWKLATRVLWRTPIYVRPTHDFDTKAATPAQDEFASLYQPRVRSTFSQVNPEDKVNRLVMDWVEGKQLPGVGLPTASTLIHFFHPTTVPIFDQRTVRTLFRAGYTSFGKSENCYMSITRYFAGSCLRFSAI